MVVDALNMAVWVRRGVELAEVICHSDAGGQYVSIAYTDRLDDIGAARSIGTVGDSFNSAMAESVTGLFKTEPQRNLAALAANGGHWRSLDTSRTRTLSPGGSSAASPQLSQRGSGPAVRPTSGQAVDRLQRRA